MKNDCYFFQCNKQLSFYACNDLRKTYRPNNCKDDCTISRNDVQNTVLEYEMEQELRLDNQHLKFIYTDHTTPDQTRLVYKLMEFKYYTLLTKLQNMTKLWCDLLF